MLKNKKLLIGGLVVAAAIGFLAFNALSGATSYYYQVGELLGKGDALYGQNVRVRGVVAVGTFKQQVAEKTTTSFVMNDSQGRASLPVVYQGAVPDSFKEGNEVVCEGRLGADGTFQATTLMPKCPSKYTPG